VDLKVPIKIFDELSESIVESTGLLDMASGEIRTVEYIDHDVDASGFPPESEDYEFTMGMLSNGTQDVEFSILVDVLNRKYSVTPTELLEIKGRAAKLFSGQTGDTPSVTPIKPRRSGQ
jgi:hypothetical protein